MIENKTGFAEGGWRLNELASENQQMDLNAREDVVKAGRRSVMAVEEGLAVVYALDGKMNLASRAERQLVQIAQIKLPAKTYYEAIPLLTDYVGRGAELTNTSDYLLLAGPYSAYIGGEFVGSGQVSVVARGQNMRVGFGVDSQLRCRRELLDKSDQASWGNRVQTFHYRLRLENFKGTPVEIRLIDRIPASKSEDVKISLGNVTTPLSTDEVYQRDMKPSGILRWDVTLPGQSSGAKAMDISYFFEVKYAKNKVTGYEAVPQPAAMRAAYDMFMVP
jgi:uncharacterized protein (TIGR02231 family)